MPRTMGALRAIAVVGLLGIAVTHAAAPPVRPTAASRSAVSEGGWMKAVAWHGKRDVRVDTVPDPAIQDPTDVIVRITSSGICGSDLHLYEVLGPFLEEGDVLGHEPMGVVEELGGEVTELSVGDRVVIPFNISCGTCFMCSQGLHSQCETTQVHDQGMG